MNLKLKEIIKITNAELIIGNENETCENFSYDTRTIQKGDIYIGFKGEKIDGSIYWKDALDKGAKAVIVGEIELLQDDIKNTKNKENQL